MLDPVGRREVMSTVKWLNREKALTVVLITHHMDEAAQADRVVVMNDGRVAADGTPAEVFRDVEGLKALGLEAPETVTLLHELRKAGVDVPADALSVDECAAVLARLLS
jgi:energy-coupling factor transport system ATP-binding protein